MTLYVAAGQAAQVAGTDLTWGLGGLRQVTWCVRYSESLKDGWIRTVMCAGGPAKVRRIYRNYLYHRLLYTWIGHEIFGTAIRVVIAVDDGCEMYLSRAENMKL